jgi:hypothetical protein
MDHANDIYNLLRRGEIASALAKEHQHIENALDRLGKSARAGVGREVLGKASALSAPGDSSPLVPNCINQRI